MLGEFDSSQAIEMDRDIRTTQPLGGSMLSSTSLRGTTPSTPSTSDEKHTTSTSQFKATGMSKAWLSCVTFIARSVCNKLSLLHCFIYNKNYELIFITESWFNDTVTNGLIDPQCRYHIVRRDRDDRGESVFCYYDRSITLSMILIYSAISNYCVLMLLSAASDSGF